MYCFTGPQCLDLCSQAVNKAPDDKIKKYIQMKWLKTRLQWAMFARQHSPLLLQVSTTNPCEAWHRKLKAGANLSKGLTASHGLYGMILNIIQAADDVDKRAATAAYNFRRKHLSVTTRGRGYPEISFFPHPIQKLLSMELEGVEKRLAASKEIPQFDDTLTCYCQFARHYLLPCRHIFHLDSEIPGGILTEKWSEYQDLFRESGMEVYEGIQRVTVEREDAGSLVDSSRLRRVIELRDLQEQLQQQLYGVFEYMHDQQLDQQVQEEVGEVWLHRLRTVIQPLANLPPEEIVRHRPWEL